MWFQYTWPGGWGGALQTIAAYLRFHLGRLDKLQGKVMTQKLEWWIILMVDYCVTLFLLYNPPLHFAE